MVGDIMQPTHLLFVLVVALLVLGPKRLPEVGRQLGNGLRDFRAAINGERTEPHEGVTGTSAPAPIPEPAAAETIAETATETPAEHTFAHEDPRPCPRLTSSPIRSQDPWCSSRTSLRTRPSSPPSTSSPTRRPSPPSRGPTRSTDPTSGGWMSSARDRAALVALLRLGRVPERDVAAAVEAAGSALAVLERELTRDGNQASLLPGDPGPLLDVAARDIAGWRERGFAPVSVLDAAYPENLRQVHDRPPLVFVAGRLVAQDQRSVAVIGARRASESGVDMARQLAAHLVAGGYTVISGLAAGIDTAAHEAALAAGGRTVAVIGTGLGHAYPAQNRDLQARIAREGAVVSQFWPDDPPTRETFPRRNAVMSGLARGTAVVEASERSGARVQARLALAHGRPVFLMPGLLEQPWARELALRPGVHVVRGPGEITARVERMDATDALVE